MGRQEYQYNIMKWSELTEGQQKRMCTGGLREAEANRAKQAFKKYYAGRDLSPQEKAYIDRGKAIYYKPGQEGGIPHTAKTSHEALQDFLSQFDFSHVKAHADGGGGEADNIKMELRRYNQDRGREYRWRSQKAGKRVPEDWKPYQQEAAKRAAYAKAQESHKKYPVPAQPPVLPPTSSPQPQSSPKGFFEQIFDDISGFFFSKPSSSKGREARSSSQRRVNRPQGSYNGTPVNSYYDDQGTAWYDTSNPGDKAQYWTDAPPETWSDPQECDDISPDDLSYDESTARDCADSSSRYIGTDADGNNYFED